MCHRPNRNDLPMSETDLAALGFERDKFDVLFAKACRVTFNRSDGEWEVDVLLPSGRAVGFSVAFDDVIANN